MVCCGDRSSVLVEWCAVVTDYQFLLSEVLWCAGNSLLHLAAKSVNQAAGIFLAQHGAAVSHANIKVGVGPLVCDECWHVVLCCVVMPTSRYGLDHLFVLSVGTLCCVVMPTTRYGLNHLFVLCVCVVLLYVVMLTSRYGLDCLWVLNVGMLCCVIMLTPRWCVL